jgi:hypothetical protein
VFFSDSNISSDTVGALAVENILGLAGLCNQRQT